MPAGSCSKWPTTATRSACFGAPLALGPVFRRYWTDCPSRSRSTREPDARTPPSMRAYIEHIARHDGQAVEIRGWLVNRRSSGKIHFLQVRDGSGFIQAVMSKAAVGDDAFKVADHLSQESAIVVTGAVRADSRAPGGFEIDAAGLEV